MNNAVQKMRNMVRFFNSVDESVLDAISTVAEAEVIFESAMVDPMLPYEHNNEVVRRGIATLRSQT